MRALTILAVFIAGCATAHQLEWSSEWNGADGARAELKGILLKQSESISHICPLGVSEDLEGCVELRNAQVNAASLEQLHAKCVIASGIIKTELPPGSSGRSIGIRAMMLSPLVTPCAGG